MKKECIFCKIVKRVEPASIIYEDGLILALMNIYPINPGHVLVIPKKHYEAMEDADDKTLERLIVISKKINIALRSVIGCEGINNEVVNGKDAGQEIFHLHFHVIPRFKKDGYGWRFPRGHLKKKTKGQAANRRELDKMASKIKRCLKD